MTSPGASARASAPLASAVSPAPMSDVPEAAPTGSIEPQAEIQQAVAGAFRVPRTAWLVSLLCLALGLLLSVSVGSSDLGFGQVVGGLHRRPTRCHHRFGAHVDPGVDPVAVASAPGRARRAGRRRAGDERRRVPGSVPQPAGRPLPAGRRRRCRTRRHAGHRHRRPLRVGPFPRGAGRRVPGWPPRRGDRRRPRFRLLPVGGVTVAGRSGGGLVLHRLSNVCDATELRDPQRGLRLDPRSSRHLRLVRRRSAHPLRGGLRSCRHRSGPPSRRHATRRRRGDRPRDQRHRGPGRSRGDRLTAWRPPRSR